MGIVVFIRGLEGQNALKSGYNRAAGPNERTVHEAAQENGWASTTLTYQSDEIPNPTMFCMESTIAGKLAEVLVKANGSPVLIVTSSVGTSAAVGALSRLNNTTSPLALLAFKPVPDALMAIPLQIGKQLTDGILSGAIPEIPMPVESADGIKDTFKLTAAHLKDPDAIRLLSNEKSVQAFNKGLGRAITNATIIYGNNDHLTPSVHMTAFRNAIWSTKAEMVDMPGNHADDFTEMLGYKVSEMIAKLG